MKHIHILGICGTFMGALAVLAKQQGYKVTGADQNVYPPMSTYLQQMGIEIISGFDISQLDCKPDKVIIGNTMKRGLPIIEAILERSIPYTSGPQWLYDAVLKNKKVIAVSGTHGKTTTTSLIAKILDYAGFNPGFFIGGVPQDFGVSARLTDAEYFVIEADEYDTAFFDKRSKFMHYHPQELVINNLEFDHADIFEGIKDIYRQFHYLIRTLPKSARIFYPLEDAHVSTLLDMGCWSTKIPIKTKNLIPLSPDFSHFMIEEGSEKCEISWMHLGLHNAQNALSAYKIAKALGIDTVIIAKALQEFKGVKRRLECLYKNDCLAIYDDFAHHPTAVLHTLNAVKSKAKQDEKVIAIIEARSNTMKQGVHKEALCSALKVADEVWFYQHEQMQWHIASLSGNENILVFDSIEAIVERFSQSCIEKPFQHFVIMSNSGFGGLQQKLQNMVASNQAGIPNKA
ncbi:UDP-N-acetylmuramate:L-alanyl-gamma-D-glutamyl-meso-diaminopimelate ligase [Facilibium subflavum]|uniref:UDP-N-acetylmuramate:L-alanyl-gamma-D-glutamyl- meso-diaminopimelate ligase n=1 Tax=Facilibium subflavum TaxID=2219058 RepID=UPI000E648405|nr:UDP-N-acetylmuramate:L-alanyl-gamma-D-glutamyl-meso-diaminopimelate ligase [Facilibium subflavum]